MDWKTMFAWVLVLLLVAGSSVSHVRPGETSGGAQYQVLSPIRHGGLTIFPSSPAHRTMPGNSSP
jgi:hypothetical protein